MERLIRLSILLFAGLLTIAFIKVAVTTKIDHVSKFSRYGSTDVATIAERERQLSCLALNIYKEAGYEPFEGKVGVAQVTMNRVKSSDFPNDVCQVVYQKNVIMEKVICQFSWHCDRVHRTRPVNQQAYDESFEVAKKVLLEGFKLKVLDDALYYHADYVNPQWRLDKIGKIGRHIFYKNRT